VANNQARFEFRVWGDELDDASSRLSAVAGVGEELQSDETYVVALNCGDCNPKIRGGVLDIKILVAVSRACEQWQPRLKAEFPIPAALLVAEVLPRLGITDATLDRDAYPAAAFVEEIVQPHPRLRSVEVSKRRLKYAVAGCFAEVAEVTVDGHTMSTVAVESADVDALWDLCCRIGIEGGENVNYPRALKQVLGLERT
jgi:hypothetical protein